MKIDLNKLRQNAQATAELNRNGPTLLTGIIEPEDILALLDIAEAAKQTMSQIDNMNICSCDLQVNWICGACGLDKALSAVKGGSDE